MKKQSILGTAFAVLVGSAAATAFGTSACQTPSRLHQLQVVGDTIPERRDPVDPEAIPPQSPILDDLEIDAAEAGVDESLHEAEVVERPRIGDETPRQLDVRGAALSEAIHLIASMAGVNIYLDAGLTDQVDASFPSVTLDDALGVLLDRNGLTLIEDPPGIYWVSAHDGSQLESATFHLRSVNGEDVFLNLQELLSDDTTLVVDRNQNFVVIRGRQDDVDAAREYLSEADRLKKQVLIEVQFLEIALDDRFEFGVQHLLTDPNFLGETVLGVDQDLSTGDDSFTAMLDLKEFSLTSTINALSRYGIVSVLSSPTVMAVTNTEASIEVVTEVPYIDTSTSIESGGGDAGTTSSQESVAFKEAGIKLTVTPIVQAGGVIQLAIDQEFSEVVDYFVGVPVLDTRKVVNQFLVNGRQTVVIGGLMQDRISETDEGVPILMHIPLLGRLFRNDDDRIRKRELLIMITPRELNPSEAAALAGKYEGKFEQRTRAVGLEDIRSR